MDGSMFNGLDTAIRWLAIIAMIAVPFAIWKAIEIVVWLFAHVSIAP